AAGIVADMNEHVGAGDALGKSAGRCASLAFGAAIGMRGCGKVGGADLIPVGIAAQQFLNACAVGARRRAEDAIKAKRALAVALVVAFAVVGAPRGGERIVLVLFLARRDRLYGSVDQRDLRRE